MHLLFNSGVIKICNLANTNCVKFLLESAEVQSRALINIYSYCPFLLLVYIPFVFIYNIWVFCLWHPMIQDK